MAIRQAALYLRSSKDRSAVSIQAQRRELQALALSRNLIVTAEFADAVESGKDIDRPGFQHLLRDMKARARPWTVILMYDTSRLGRRRYIAETFRHERKKLGVEILFAKVPEVDPISQVILDSVLQAMDEVHSLMSREKGLAGMAENVRMGFRAGGRAPYGYRLVSIDTGQLRDGEPVTKSKLEPDPLTGPRIAAWLQARAMGKNGRGAADELGIDLAKSTLTHLEWSALTYAGHTVWNVHRGKEDAGKGRRRPREEWVIQRNTHAALIEDATAEAILARLEGNKTARATRARISDYLLTGLLVTPHGQRWQGNAGNYRTSGSNIRSAILEEDLLAQVATHLRTDEFVRLLAEHGRKMQQPADETELREALKKIRSIDGRIAALMGLLEETTAKRPLLKQIEEWEVERDTWIARHAALKEDSERAQAYAETTEADLRHLLASLAEDMAALPREAQKDFLHTMIDRIELDPVSRTGSIHFRIEPSGFKLASPRGAALNPTLRGALPFRARPSRRAA